MTVTNGLLSRGLLASLAGNELIYVVDPNDTSADPTGTGKYFVLATLLATGSSLWEGLPTIASLVMFGNAQLTETYQQFFLGDPNGADRIIKAFASPSARQQISIKNTGTANTIQFQTSAGSNVGEAILPGFTKHFIYDGSEWVELSSSMPKGVYRDAALAGNLVLTSTAKEILILDPNGSDRTVTAEANPVKSRWYQIKNIGSENTLQFKDSAASSIGGAILPGFAKYFVYDGADWVELPFTDVLSSITTDATTARTLAITDANDYIRFTSSSDTILTVPLNSAVAFDIGTKIDIFRAGAGNLTVAATGGVTINKAEGLKIAAQYKGASLIKVGTDEWDLIGAIAA